MDMDLLTRIAAAIVDCDPEGVSARTREALAAGIEPLTIIDQALVPGMRTVGEKFSCGEYFLPNLIVAAKGMQQAMEILGPELKKKQQAVASPGTIVIGTVQGDIHEIGKSLVATMLAANGFEVHDLGVDVPPETFVAAVKETGAGLVGLSSLLTTTMIMQKKVIELLMHAGLRSRVKVLVGGAPVSRNWAEEIGADGYAEDAVDAVTLARTLAGTL